MLPKWFYFHSFSSTDLKVRPLHNLERISSLAITWSRSEKVEGKLMSSKMTGFILKSKH